MMVNYFVALLSVTCVVMLNMPFFARRFRMPYSVNLRRFCTVTTVDLAEVV